MKRKRQKKWYQFGEHTMYLLSLLLLMAIAVTASCGGGGGGGGDGGVGPPPPPTGRGSWTATSTIGGTGAPSARAAHSQVWTGTEIIVWGGTPDGITGLDTGGKYDPATDTWTTISTAGAPSPRFLHRANWVSPVNLWVVWGGTPDGNTGLNTGGVYDPALNSWTATNTAGAPTARFFHRIVRSGSNVIVWGGTDGTNVFDTGGIYDPVNNTWIAAPNLNTGGGNAPSPRYRHHAVRRGGPPETMIVWGGTPDDTTGLNTGGVYNPATDTWTPTAIDANTPSPRFSHSAVFASGTGVIIWGGTADGTTGLNTGGIYNAGSDTWSSITTTNAPSARFIHTADWTGTEMIVWGGTPDDATGLNTGGVYDPAADSWTPTTTTNAPSPRFWHRAVWVGAEMIVWGGTPDYASAFDTGGRYTQ